MCWFTLPLICSVHFSIFFSPLFSLPLSALCPPFLSTLPRFFSSFHFSFSSMGKIIDQLTDLGHAGRGCFASCRLARRRRGQSVFPVHKEPRWHGAIGGREGGEEKGKGEEGREGGWEGERTSDLMGKWAPHHKCTWEPTDYSPELFDISYTLNSPYPVYPPLFPAFCSASMPCLFQFSSFFLLLAPPFLFYFSPPSKTMQGRSQSPPT